MWWELQTEEMKDKVRDLVNNGQLEFVGGAWSQNDEGVTHYQSIIDQFTLGLRYVINKISGPLFAVTVTPNKTTEP